MTCCWVMAIWSFHTLARERTPDNGQRTRMWFYILSNAAMQCIGQTIIHTQWNAVSAWLLQSVLLSR